MTTQYTTPQTPKSTILAILEDRPIAYHPILAKALGGVKQAVFVSQLLYWTGKGKRADGFIWKTQEEWTDETGLSAYEQRTARKHLVKSGVLQEKLKSVPARLYYRLNTDVLQTRVVEYHEQVMKDLHNKSNTTLPAIPEITPEITTQEEPPLADSPVEDTHPDPSELCRPGLPGLLPLIDAPHPTHDIDGTPLPPELWEDWAKLDEDVPVLHLEESRDEGEVAFWAEGETPPEPSSQEAPEKRIERLRHELGTDPLQVAAVVEQNRAREAHPDGGDPSRDGDPWANGPLAAFCAIIHVPGPKHLSPSDQRNWPNAFKEWSESWEDKAPTPQEAVRCMEGFLESELNWQTFKRPYEDGFKATMNIMLSRLRGGQPWNAEGRKAGGSSGGRNDAPQVDQAVAETMASLFDERGVRIRRE